MFELRGVTTRLPPLVVGLLVVIVFINTKW